MTVAHHAGTVDESGIARRHLGTAAGDALILTADALDYSTIASRFLDQSGLRRDDIATPVVSLLPIPVHAQRADIAHSTPEAWANPVFWLPHRWRCDVEGWCSDTAALRIIVELIAANLYEPEHGFVDVLALHGLDVDDDADRARVQAWIAGGEDELLDSIDVTELLLDADDDPDWARRWAEESVETVILSCYAAISRSIREWCDDVAAGDEDEVIDQAPVICRLLAALLRAVPTDEGLVFDVYSEMAETIMTTSDAEEALAAATSLCDEVLAETEDVLVAFVTGDEPLPDTVASDDDAQEER